MTRTGLHVVLLGLTLMRSMRMTGRSVLPAVPAVVIQTRTQTIRRSAPLAAGPRAAMQMILLSSPMIRLMIRPLAVRAARWPRAALHFDAGAKRWLGQFCPGK